MKELATKLKGLALAYSYQIFVFITFLVIYLITIYPGAGGRINFGDSIKWQYLYLANGLPHGTGYPQFLALSEIFSRIIFFLDKPERITFIAVFFGALSLSVFYSLIYLLTRNKLGSFISTLVLGFTYNFWAEATEAEVYTFNVFYLLSVFYLFIQFYLTKNTKYYLWGCAVYALSFGNHLSMVTILPAVLFISLITDYKIVFKPKNLLLVALFVLVGMLQYGFLYYRATSGNPEYKEIIFNPTFAQFFHYITGSDAKSIMLAFPFDKVVFERFPILFRFLNDNFTVLGLLFAGAGFFYYLYVKRQYVISGFLSLAMFGQIFFNISYNVPDLPVFFIPVYVLTAIFIGMVFSTGKDFIPKVCLVLLTIYLFLYNTSTNGIVTKNTYETFVFKQVLSLYQEQKDVLPLYVRSADYNMHQYMNYKNLTGDLKPKSVVPFLDLIQSDSFYVANERAYFPEIGDQFDFKLVAVENIKDFVQKRSKPNTVIFFSAMDEASHKLPPDFIHYLKQYGSKIDSLPFRGSYGAVLYNGKIIEEINGAGPVTIISDSLKSDPLKGKVKYEIFSGGEPFGNNSMIHIDGFDYSYKRRGMNIVVYDTQINEVTDIVSYDTHLGEERKLFKVIKNRPEVLATQAVRIPVLTEQYNVKPINSESIKDFVQKRSNANTVIFFSAMDDASHNLSHDLKAYLKKYGSKIDSLPYRGSYGAVLYNGKLIEEINGAGPVTIISDGLKSDPLKGKVKYKIFSAGQPFGNNSTIIINNFDYSVKGRGMNIVIYDTQINQVTDIVCYDTHLGEEKKSLRAFRK